MKKFSLVYWSFLAIFSLIFSMQTVRAQTVWDGTADVAWYGIDQNSFDISTPEQLAGLARLVNDATTDFSGITINLTADIWLNAYAGDTTNRWIPIGGGTRAIGELGGEWKCFAGNFNGNGHTIYNMYCDNGYYYQAGLFGAVNGPMTIQKLALANPTVRAAGMVGAIVGFTAPGGDIYIKNCMVMNADIKGNIGNNIGCIIGANYHNSSHTYVWSCGATGTVSGQYAGGLGGNCQQETFTNCYFAGTVTGANSKPVGGIAGYSGNIINCHSNVESFADGNSGNLKTASYMRSDTFLLDLDTSFKADCSLNDGFPLQIWQECGVPVVGNRELCLGESTTLTTCGFVSYLWSTGDNTASITVTPDETTDYYITATDANSIVRYDTVTVTIHQDAVVTAAAMPGVDGIAHGTVTPDVYSIPCGSTDLVPITITPDNGYHISKIVVNGEVVREDDPADGEIITYYADPDGALFDIRVYFSNVYQIKVLMELDDGTIFSNPFLTNPWGLNGTYTVNPGENAKYHFYENAHYHLVDVSIDGVSQGPVYDYSFVDIDRSSTIMLTYQDFCGIIAMPYLDNFETYSDRGDTVLPDCWSRGGADDRYPAIQHNQTHSGSNSLYFHFDANSCAVMPAIDTLNYPINTLMISYKLYVGYASNPFVVGIMTDPNDTSTFTPLFSHQNTEIREWESYTDYFSDFTGSGSYIAFRWHGYGWLDGGTLPCECFLDDVEISTIPDCSPVLNLTVTEAAYDAETGEGTATINWSPGIVGMADSYTIEYKPRDDDDWIFADIVTDTVYILSGLTPSTGYNVRVAANCGTIVSDWADAIFAIPCDAADMCEYTIKTRSSYSWNGNKLDIYLNGIYSQSIAQEGYSSEIHTFSVCDGDFLELKFNRDAAGDPFLNYVAFTLTEPYGVDLFNCDEYGAASYSDHEVIYSGITSCDPPQCVRAENISVIGGATSAEVSWTDAGETSVGWILEYGPAGFVQGTGTTTMAYDSPYTIENLERNTAYDLYMRTYCDDGDTSYYTDKVNFRTYLCDASERCDYIFVMNDSEGDGWNGNFITIFVEGDSLTEITLQGGQTGTETLSFCNNSTIALKWHKFPVFSFFPDRTDEISFSVKKSSNDEILYTCTDGSTLSADSIFFVFTVDCTLPDCMKPSDVLITDITQTSANISWTETGTASTWIIEYGPTGFAHGNGTTGYATETAYTLDLLMAGTYYDVYVRAVCGEDDTSAWSPVCTFATLCDNIVDLPFIENFDGDNIHGDFIKCWTRHTSNPEHVAYVRADHTQSFSPPRMLDLHYTPDCSVMAILPSFDPSIPLNELTVTFQSRTADIAAGVKEIGIMTDADDTASYQRISLINHTVNNEYEMFEIPLTDYTGYGSYIAFKYTNGGNKQFLIDDLQVDYTPVCPTPTNLMIADVTDSSATLSWEQDGDVSDWSLDYKLVDADVWTTFVTADNPHTIANLMPETDYVAKIRANCGTAHSEYTDAIAFTTATAPSNIDSRMIPNDIILCPNPTSDYVDVKCNGNITVRELKVYDVYGKLLQAVEVNESLTRVDVSGLASGVYFIRVFSDKGIANKSFIKK